MRLAYADPPYPGCAGLYPEKTEVDHMALIADLQEYDGWALSTNETTLAYVLGLCPPKVRVLAWCKPNAPPFYLHPCPSWEPVILKPARQSAPGPAVRSYLEVATPAGFVRAQAGIIGQKPRAFCEWVIRCLGAEYGDTLVDMFPGTGAMTHAWQAWLAQPPLWVEPRGSKRHRAKIRERQLRGAVAEQESA